MAIVEERPTRSMSRTAADVSPSAAPDAIAIGIVANTLLNLAISMAIGRSSFRRRAMVELSSLAAASAVGLLIGRVSGR